MERLRYVARSGGGDPAMVIADTVEAIRSLAPGPGELVSLCRNLVDRAITCGPLWWLCARLLSEPDALRTAWDLADEIAEDPTVDHLAATIPEDAVVLTVGYPALAARALARRGDITVLAVDAGHAANALVRLLDRGGGRVDPRPPGSDAVGSKDGRRRPRRSRCLLGNDRRGLDRRRTRCRRGAPTSGCRSGSSPVAGAACRRRTSRRCRLAAATTSRCSPRRCWRRWSGRMAGGRPPRTRWRRSAPRCPSSSRAEGFERQR